MVDSNWISQYLGDYLQCLFCIILHIDCLKTAIVLDQKVSSADLIIPTTRKTSKLPVFLRTKKSYITVSIKTSVLMMYDETVSRVF